MDTKKLAVFIDLAETKNYSRSAERMFLSQSTISKYIIELEKEWQIKLFIRAHREVKLTAAGKLILPKVKAILEKEQELNQLIDSQVWEKKRPLVIQGLPSLPQYQAFHIITAFTKKYPQIKLKFNEASVDKLQYSLEQKDVDIIFTRVFDADLPDCDVLVNESDRFVVLIPKTNPLSQKNYVSPKCLKTNH